jgi:hypothetical protein
MNKWKLFGGIVCLALAGLLAVLNAVLAEGKVVFMVDGTNMPMIPVIVLALVGFGLLVTAWQGQVGPFSKQ